MAGKKKRSSTGRGKKGSARDASEAAVEAAPVGRIDDDDGSLRGDQPGAGREGEPITTQRPEEQQVVKNVVGGAVLPSESSTAEQERAQLTPGRAAQRGVPRVIPDDRDGATVPIPIDPSAVAETAGKDLAESDGTAATTPHVARIPLRTPRGTMGKERSRPTTKAESRTTMAKSESSGSEADSDAYFAPIDRRARAKFTQVAAARLLKEAQALRESEMHVDDAVLHDGEDDRTMDVAPPSSRKRVHRGKHNKAKRTRMSGAEIEPGTMEEVGMGDDATVERGEPREVRDDHREVRGEPLEVSGDRNNGQDEGPQTQITSVADFASPDHEARMCLPDAPNGMQPDLATSMIVSSLEGGFNANSMWAPIVGACGLADWRTSVVRSRLLLLRQHFDQGTRIPRNACLIRFPWAVHSSGLFAFVERLGMRPLSGEFQATYTGDHFERDPEEPVTRSVWLPRACAQAVVCAAANESQMDAEDMHLVVLSVRLRAAVTLIINLVLAGYGYTFRGCYHPTAICSAAIAEPSFTALLTHENMSGCGRTGVRRGRATSKDETRTSNCADRLAASSVRLMNRVLDGTEAVYDAAGTHSILRTLLASSVAWLEQCLELDDVVLQAVLVNSGLCDGPSGLYAQRLVSAAERAAGLAELHSFAVMFVRAVSARCVAAGPSGRGKGADSAYYDVVEEWMKAKAAEDDTDHQSERTEQGGEAVDDADDDPTMPMAGAFETVGDE